MPLRILAGLQPKKDVHITLRVPRETKAGLQRAAARRRRSTSWLAQDILDRWLAQERKRHPR